MFNLFYKKKGVLVLTMSQKVCILLLSDSDFKILWLCLVGCDLLSDCTLSETRQPLFLFRSKKKMIKKSDLRAEFERIVTTQKTAIFDFFWKFPISSFNLVVVGSPFFKKPNAYIALRAISSVKRDDGMPYMMTIARSYPMSYKTAYQTLVRL